MNRIGAALTTIAMLVFAGSAQARSHQVHVADAACPAGTPVQTITVVNQANVRPAALALVENAVVAQSLQVRAAWGTPCVVFGPGGWKLYLKTGATGEPWGEHFSNRGLPYLLVWTGALRSGARARPALGDRRTRVRADHELDRSRSGTDVAQERFAHAAPLPCFEDRDRDRRRVGSFAIPEQVLEQPVPLLRRRVKLP
jgi:hypothetical protein